MDVYDFDDNEAHREVASLYQLAMDFSDDALFATSERLLSQAYVIAERLNDLSLLVKVVGD